MSKVLENKNFFFFMITVFFNQTKFLTKHII